MKRKSQGNLFDQVAKRGRKPSKPMGHFGGMYLKSYNPKVERPMDSKKALHLVLRSSQATGSKSLKNFDERIWEIISNHAKKSGVHIYEYANGGNHLHLLIRAKHRGDYNTFVRTITGLIARVVGKSERGQPLAKKFWDGRPFTRVVSFGQKDFKTAKTYLLRNSLEAVGWLPYVPRNQKLPLELRNWLASGPG